MKYFFLKAITLLLVIAAAAGVCLHFARPAALSGSAHTLTVRV